MANTAAPAHHRTSGLIGRLNSDWAARQDRLADFGRLGTITYAQAFAAGGEQGPFYELLVEAVGGNEPARRALLQRELGTVVRFTRTCKGLQHMDHEDAVAIAVAAMWDAIRTYPTQRTTSPTGNLAMNALKAITRRHPVPAMAEVAAEAAALEGIKDATGIAHPHDEDHTCFEQFINVLSWAVDTPATTRPGMVLSREDAALLGRWTVSDTTERERLAHELGKSKDTLKVAVSRLRSRLRSELAERALERANF